MGAGRNNGIGGFPLAALQYLLAVKLLLSRAVPFCGMACKSCRLNEVYIHNMPPFAGRVWVETM